MLLETSGVVRSLSWHGDALVDVVGGGRRWAADGTEHRAEVSWGSLLDRAVSHRRYAVLYVERGTKAVLVKDGKLLRELNRSYYLAEAYDYPVALGTLPDGLDVIAHCPDRYNVLEIEELESGRRITTGDRDPADVFHSQLQFSPDGRRLLSVGWMWHPVGVAHVFDVERAVVVPAALDGEGLLPLATGRDADIVSACWLDADRLAVAAGDDVWGGEQGAVLGPQQLGIWSFAESAWVHRHSSDRPLGALLGRGNRLVSLSGHPRALSAETGELLVEWPEVRVPERRTSYGRTDEPSPVAALHPDGRRLAVAGAGGIHLLLVP
ncbi:hypothetical protein [Kribbella flavida]|nr:hypothetical protein [Kribbella flavida]